MKEQLVVDFPALGVVTEGGQEFVSTIDEYLTIPYTQTFVTGTQLPAFYMESTVDLQGFMMEEDTVLIPEAYLIQDPGIYALIMDDDIYTGLGGALHSVEVISTRKLDMQQVIDDIVWRVNYPGQLLSDYDKQQIVMGEARWFQPTTPAYQSGSTTPINTPGILLLNRQGTFGYTAKIANPRLFAYRILIPYFDLLDFPGRLTVPPLRIRMEVTPKKMSEVQYIYALKRNTELHQ